MSQAEVPNWRDLPAGKELDILIARMLGWSVSTNPLGNTATLWTPDLKIVDTWGSSEAWPTVTGVAWCNAPHFSQSVDDALTLWDTLPDNLLPRLVRMWQPSSYFYKSSIIDTEHPEGIREIVDVTGGTPALAICRSWLEWKEHNDRT